MRNFYTLAIFILAFSCYSQSWQWGKRGGSANVLDVQSFHRQEEVFSIVTDREKNVYTLSTVGINHLNIDGHPKTNYGDGVSITDYAMASFSCDGSYRWSKVIGGSSFEDFQPLQIDQNDNIYIAGKYGNSSGPTYAQNIDEDFVFPRNPADHRRLILIKYDNDGNLQWYHKPEPTTLTETGPAISKGFATEANGTSHWLVRLPEGVYADGAFNNTLPGNNWYILKYDTNGNFLNAIALNFEVTNYFATTLKFFRNPYNGQYFITGRKGSSSQESAIINGQEVTHTMFLASFDSNGQFLWTKENTSNVNGGFQLYNLAFDPDNSIYIGGRLIGLSIDSFLGISIPGPIAPGLVMKVNPNADTVIWSTYHNKSALRGAITLNGDEVGFTDWCLGIDFTWGDQTMNVTGPDQGTDVLLARFNKDTGACLGLNRIDSAVGSYDCGTAITADASGDYIVGGGFQSNISINGQTMYNLDSQSDFFVAKYALEPCSELANTDHLKDQFRVYPNPAKDNFIVESVDSLRYEIFNFTGALVAKGTTQKQTNINVSGFAAGVYLLRLYSADGFVKTVKLLKE